MTYRQPPTCRRGGCGELAAAGPASNEGDLGWCEWHRAQVQARRHAFLTAPVNRVRPERRTTRKARL